MVRNRSIIKIEGKLGNLSFYLSNGDIVRTIDAGASERVKNSPKFERFREGQRVFGACSSSRKIIRKGLGEFYNKNAVSVCGELES